jgi:hypothetical protein
MARASGEGEEVISRFFMNSDSSENRFYNPPSASSLGEDEVRSHVRAEFFDVRNRFLDRLSCAQVFDRELFDALLLWLETLGRCYVAADLPMNASDFDRFNSISSYLEQEATYSRDQKTECAAAHLKWIGIMQQLNLPSIDNP